MNAARFILLLLAAFPLLLCAASDYKSPLSALETILNGTGIPSLPALLGGNSSVHPQAAGVGNPSPSSLAGITGALANASSGNLAGLAGVAGAAGLPSIQLPKPPTIAIPLSQLRILVAIAIILFYVFAAGKIADFLQSGGRKITKREALLAPFAMLVFSALAISLYFLSGAYKPPQDSLITNIVFYLLIPAGILIAAGAAVLYGFFRDRLNPLQSIDLSIHVVLSPLFDGMKGYWIALGAAAILATISGIVYYSSGGKLSLVTFDFLLLSIVVSLYYLYRAITAQNSENRASNIVTVLCLLAPSLMQRYLKDAVCAVLVRLPFGLFSACPLDSVGSDITLALSIGATMLLLVPIVPFVYAFAVNLLRACTLAALLLKSGPKKPGAGQPGKGGEESGEGDGPDGGGASGESGAEGSSIGPGQWREPEKLSRKK